MELFDTHCHLDFPVFDADRKLLIEKSLENGIQNILLPGVKKEDWRVLRMHVALNKPLHAALGLHPMFIDEHTEQHLHDLDMALNLPPVVAVGEIGLDFYDRSLDREKQESFFRAQLKIAKKRKLPILLHVRKAHDEVLKHLGFLQFTEGGIVHAFNGSLQHAKNYISKGFKLGFGGTMTYSRSVKIRELAKIIPLESIVLETDAPDMVPSSSSSKRNTPVHLLDNFRALCKLRGESPEEIARVTTSNAKKVLRLD
ncbi:MAG: hydrolase TatD [Gammaproteobacteria bacterium]|nr:MAG: hydrolase TatD [Gammaproteobacteria bacterium]